MKTKTLVLVPTEFEAKFVRPLITPVRVNSEVVLQTCGFGPAVTGAKAMQLIHEYEPDRVILTGIAGTLSQHHRVGTASQFTHVSIYGVGAGHGEAFSTAGELGWPQLPGSGKTKDVNDVVELHSAGHTKKNLLLTSCAASAGPDEANWRRQKFPDAEAEDMEGFSVAVACELANVSLEIVRGISNVAGDRNKDHWQIENALVAASELVMELLT